MPAPIVEVRDLVKHYGATVALQGVCCEVGEGAMFGLLGPNGAGKTTLLSILSCLLTATSGEARILGRVVHPGDKDLRRQIGIVPQELAIYGELTARENLAFFGKLYGIGGAVLKRRVDQVLDAAGLTDRADSRADTYSGGMKRRLNLGAALIHQPKLLMLDEPTTGVDPQSRNRIFEEVRRLNAAGTTVIYTSHYMEEVQTLCKQIAIIDHGNIIACDSLPGLLRQLKGAIQLRVPAVTDDLRRHITALPEVKLTVRDDGLLELECADMKAALIKVVAILSELHVELISLETEEPNLERVFLHLTGRALRD